MTMGCHSSSALHWHVEGRSDRWRSSRPLPVGGPPRATCAPFGPLHLVRLQGAVLEHPSWAGGHVSGSSRFP
jgi:hypothetical protein